MAEKAGYVVKVYYSADDVTYTLIESLSTFSDEITANLQSIAELGGGGWDAMLPTLKGITISLDGNLDTTNAQHTALLTKLVAGTAFYVKVLFDGSSVGYKCEVYAGSLSRSAEAGGGILTFSASLTGTAAPTTLP